ncbi:hypothetical protein HDZ31DRAFT_38762 [Schizophyllum fasciatum]
MANASTSYAGARPRPDAAADLNGRPVEDARVRLPFPDRLWIVPLGSSVLGTLIGLRRGARHASLQYRAENAHRPPRTVGGWYFYHKTKNYRVILGALRQGGRTGPLVGAIAGTYVFLEDLVERAGWGDVRAIAAGLGTSAAVSAVYRLPWYTMKRTMGLGVMGGCMMQAVYMGIAWAEVQARVERAQREAREREEAPRVAA